MVDATEVIAYLVRDTDLSDTVQVTTFVGHRPTDDGSMREVTVEVLDAGEGAHERYTVFAGTEDGKEALGDPAATLDEAVSNMAAHWSELD